MSSYDILPPKENFRGMSYGEWAAEWWKWLVSEDADTYLQKDPVLFLRGAFDYETANGQRRPKRKLHKDRTGNEKIEISEGTAIFFPVIEAEFNEEGSFVNCYRHKIRAQKDSNENSFESKL